MCWACGYAFRIYVVSMFVFLQLIPHFFIVLIAHNVLECKISPQESKLVELQFMYVLYFQKKGCMKLDNFPPGAQPCSICSQSNTTTNSNSTLVNQTIINPGNINASQVLPVTTTTLTSTSKTTAEAEKSSTTRKTTEGFIKPFIRITHTYIKPQITVGTTAKKVEVKIIDSKVVDPFWDKFFLNESKSKPKADKEIFISHWFSQIHITVTRRPIGPKNTLKYFGKEQKKIMDLDIFDTKVSMKPFVKFTVDLPTETSTFPFKIIAITRSQNGFNKKDEEQPLRSRLFKNLQQLKIKRKINKLKAALDDTILKTAGSHGWRAIKIEPKRLRRRWIYQEGSGGSEVLDFSHSELNTTSKILKNHFPKIKRDFTYLRVEPRHADSLMEEDISPKRTSKSLKLVTDLLVSYIKLDTDYKKNVLTLETTEKYIGITEGPSIKVSKNYSDYNLRKIFKKIDDSRNSMEEKDSMKRVSIHENFTEKWFEDDGKYIRITESPLKILENFSEKHLEKILKIANGSSVEIFSILEKMDESNLESSTLDKIWFPPKNLMEEETVDSLDLENKMEQMETTLNPKILDISSRIEESMEKLRDLENLWADFQKTRTTKEYLQFTSETKKDLSFLETLDISKEKVQNLTDLDWEEAKHHKRFLIPNFREIAELEKLKFNLTNYLDHLKKGELRSRNTTAHKMFPWDNFKIPVDYWPLKKFRENYRRFYTRSYMSGHNANDSLDELVRSTEANELEDLNLQNGTGGGQVGGSNIAIGNKSGTVVILYPDISPQYEVINELVWAYMVLDILWFIATVIIIRGAKNKIRGIGALCFYLPWLLVTLAIIAADIAGFIICLPHIHSGLYLLRYLKLAGITNYEDVEKKKDQLPNYNKAHVWGPIIMCVFFLRALFFFIINIIAFCKICQVLKCVLMQKVVEKSIIKPFPNFGKCGCTSSMIGQWYQPNFQSAASKLDYRTQNYPIVYSNTLNCGDYNARVRTPNFYRAQSLPSLYPQWSQDQLSHRAPNTHYQSMPNIHESYSDHRGASAKKWLGKSAQKASTNLNSQIKYEVPRYQNMGDTKLTSSISSTTLLGRLANRLINYI